MLAIHHTPNCEGNGEGKCGLKGNTISGGIGSQRKQMLSIHHTTNCDGNGEGKYGLKGNTVIAPGSSEDKQNPPIGLNPIINSYQSNLRTNDIIHLCVWYGVSVRDQGHANN